MFCFNLLFYLKYATVQNHIVAHRIDIYDSDFSMVSHITVFYIIYYLLKNRTAERIIKVKIIVSVNFCNFTRVRKAIFLYH